MKKINAYKIALAVTAICCFISLFKSCGNRQDISGTVIAKSGANKLNTDSTNALHFEVYYKGQLINPEEFYLYNYNDIMEK